MLIFEAGFSTAEVVTEVSGRGVGMDVVKRNIAALGGRIEIESMAGIGTRTTVRVPSRWRSSKAFRWRSDGKVTSFRSLRRRVAAAHWAMIRSIGGHERLLQLRGEYLLVATLRDGSGSPGHAANGARDHGIIEADGACAALSVDALVGQHQVVVKSLRPTTAESRAYRGRPSWAMAGGAHPRRGRLVSLVCRSVPAAA